jgi:uncharacterized protein (DUF169 family)
MDMEIKENFIRCWNKYFNRANLPIIIYYTNSTDNMEIVKPPSGHRCVIGDLTKVFKGETLCFHADSIGCSGGKRYLGFTEELMPNFEYFLSCGIPGKLEGERYKKTPDLVKATMKKVPIFQAPAKYLVFKRWDKLEEQEDPDVVIFLAPPDVLSGLFTLANFDEVESEIVSSPFAAGCGSIVQYPYYKMKSGQPKPVLGMFDVSARPFVSQDVLSFAIPMNKFTKMIDDMEESFLITSSWDKVKKRISNK